MSLKVDIAEFEYYHLGTLKKFETNLDFNSIIFAILIETQLQNRENYFLLFSEGCPNSAALELANIIVSKLTCNKAIAFGLYPEVSPPLAISRAPNKNTAFWSQMRTLFEKKDGAILSENEYVLCNTNGNIEYKFSVLTTEQEISVV